ncbi:MAG: histidine phosphatase family protein [Firmicutes bacterium]|nr:histidine phosphatase family protein [Bacillota bacterium]
MIYIVRHGKTELNRANVLQGRSDHPLNEEGIKQAEEASERFRSVRFDHVFTSPLIRAVQTAEIIAPHARPSVDERLIEMDYGPYEGTDLNSLPPEILTFFSDFVHNPAPEGMEQLSSVTARAGSFIEDIRGLEGDILVSTHAIAMKGILEYLTPESNGSYWSKYIGNCAVYAAENDGGIIGVPRELDPEKAFAGSKGKRDE